MEFSGAKLIDSFLRPLEEKEAPEGPGLSKASTRGKEEEWIKPSWFYNTGMIIGEHSSEALRGWQGPPFAEAKAKGGGAYYAMNIFPYPCARVEYHGKSAGWPGTERFIGVWLCLGLTHTGYFLKAEGEAGTDKWKLQIVKATAPETNEVLAEKTAVSLVPPLVLGGNLAKSGKIEFGFGTTLENMKMEIEATDTAFTTGYVGINASGNGPRFGNFEAGSERPSAGEEVEHAKKEPIEVEIPRLKRVFSDAELFAASVKQ